MLRPGAQGSRLPKIDLVEAITPIKKPAPESMGKNGGHRPADFEMRPEAGPNG